MPTFQAFAGNVPASFEEQDVIQSFSFIDLAPPFKAVVRDSKGNSAGRDKFAICYWHLEHDRDAAIAKGPVMDWIPGKQALVRLLRNNFVCLDVFHC